MGADVASIVVQGIGGAFFTSGDLRHTIIEDGNSMALAGIAIQIARLAVFGFGTLECGIRSFVHRKELVSLQTMDVIVLRNFKFFAYSSKVAYFIILIRCCYR